VRCPLRRHTWVPKSTAASPTRTEHQVVETCDLVSVSLGAGMTSQTTSTDAATLNVELFGRRERMATMLRELGVSVAVVTDPRDIQYLSGVDPLTALGPNPFTGPVSSAVVLTQEGESTLVGPQPDLSLMELAQRGIATAGFETFEDLTALRPRGRLSRAVVRLLSGFGLPASATVGIEPSALPGHLTAGLTELYPRVRFAEVESLIATQRSIKSAAEVDRIRRAVSLCDNAQEAAGRALGVGGSLGDVRKAIQASLEADAGAPLTALIEVSTQAPVTGDGCCPPNGAMVITDIAPRLDGYWGDSCDTRPKGEPASNSAMIETVSAALTARLEAARPAVRACDVDTVMRSKIAQAYPAYTGAGGHGIGLDYHETPRLTPSDTTALEAAMVLALEPGVYLAGMAVRLEGVVSLIPGGCEIVSRHLAGRGN
jgi:Xaa-Pro dipeptidase